MKKEGECVFTTPIGKRIGAFVLAGAIAGNMYIGSEILRELREDKKVVFEVMAPSVLESENEVELTQPIEENKIVPLVNETKEEDKYKELCELYDQLLISGCDMNDVHRELQNILLVKITGTNVMTEERIVLFNTLGKTIPRDVDVIDYYYPLAAYVHLKTCSEFIHNDGKCEGLTKAAENFRVISFSEYITDKVYESGSLTLRDAMERIISSEYTLEDCLVELDAIYNVCTVPTDMSEETWNQLFGRLLTVTGEYENVCYVFYDLALLVHKSVCDYPHYINMFGATECDNMTYKLT